MLRWNEENGTVAIIAAASLVMLMGFTALAVDAGNAFDDRRQQAAAADVGALAALQYANHNLPTAICGTYTGEQRAACRGTEEAFDVINGSLDSRFPFPSAEWSNCADPSPFAIVSPLTDCVSFSSNFERSRVVLPVTEVEAPFGAVVGRAAIAVSAFAEAKQDLELTADVLPFAVGPTGAGLNQACLLSNPNNGLPISPCLGGSSGNFGYLDVRLYGNTTLGTTSKCSGDTQGRLSTNIVLGADHHLTTWSAPTVNDNANCDNRSISVNELQTQTGDSTTGLGSGLFDGALGNEGRLTCKEPGTHPTKESATGSYPCKWVSNNHPEQLDDTPLWHYLKSGVCSPTPSNRAEMEACLASWVPGNGTIFEGTIIESPRYGAVPILELDPSNGSGNYRINAFKPVYFETTYYKCTSNSCDMAHSPGEGPPTAVCSDPITVLDTNCGYPLGGNKKINAVTAFVLEIEMLPDEIAEHFPSRPGTRTINLLR